MSTRRLIGPITTVAAVGLFGAGLWMVNVSQNPTSPAQIVQTPVSTAVAAPPTAPVAAAVPEAPALPARADYAADIPVQGRLLTVEISIDGQSATAYACDNAGIETWLSGTSVNGSLRLTDATGANRLTAQPGADALVGTLWIGERSWEFEATRIGNGYEY